MHELADPGAELIHWWDDDDLYCLPVAPRRLPAPHPGQRGLEAAILVVLLEVDTFSLDKARFEGSWMFRAAYLKAAPIDTHKGYSDHPATVQTIEGRAARHHGPPGRDVVHLPLEYGRDAPQHPGQRRRDEAAVQHRHLAAEPSTYARTG